MLEIKGLSFPMQEYATALLQNPKGMGQGTGQHAKGTTVRLAPLYIVPSPATPL